MIYIQIIRRKKYQIGQVWNAWQWLVDNKFERHIGQDKSERQLQAILRQRMVDSERQERQTGDQKL